MPFSERDWTHIRRVHVIAVERFCARVLDEAATIAQDDRGRSAHERSLALFRLVHERNAALATAYDDLRRSTALRRWSAMIDLGVLTAEDLAGFHPEVQAAARELSEIFAPRRPATRQGGPDTGSRQIAGASRPIAVTAGTTR